MSANKTNRQSRRLIFNSRLCSRQCHYYSYETEPQVISLDYRARSNKKKDIFQRSTRKYKIIATVITVLGVNCNFRLIAIQ